MKKIELITTLENFMQFLKFFEEVGYFYSLLIIILIIGIMLTIFKIPSKYFGAFILLLIAFFTFGVILILSFIL